MDARIIQANRPQRTGQSGEYRLSVHSEFDGPVQQGRDYLITDDNVTQGGTLADLRSYIERRDGHVVGATTLTGSRQSEILASRAETLEALRAKFPDLEANWKGAFGHDFSGLTQGEARYLLRSQRLTPSEIKSLRAHKQELHRKFDEIDARKAAEKKMVTEKTAAE